MIPPAWRMQTIRPYPCSLPDWTTVPHCAAWIGVPLATARSSPAWRCPGRDSPNRPVSVAPLTGETIRPEVQPPADVVGGGAVGAGVVCFGAGVACFDGTGALDCGADPPEPDPESADPEPADPDEPDDADDPGDAPPSLSSDDTAPVPSSDAGPADPLRSTTRRTEARGAAAAGRAAAPRDPGAS